MSKKIIIGITGSIAAFKSVQLISDLIQKRISDRSDDE